MAIQVSRRQASQLQLALGTDATMPPKRARKPHNAPKPPNPAYSNFDNRLARAASNNWYSINSTDGVTYTYTHVDGRQLVGDYNSVTRQASKGT